MKTLEEQTAEVLALDDAFQQAVKMDSKNPDNQDLVDNVFAAETALTEKIDCIAHLLRQWQERCEKLLYAEDRMAKCYHTVDFENQELKKQNTALQQRVDRMREALERVLPLFREYCRQEKKSLPLTAECGNAYEQAKQALADDGAIDTKPSAL